MSYYIRQIKDKTSAQLAKDAELEGYKGLIRKQVPSADRVGVLAKAVKKADSNPFAALKAVEYADRVLGLAPEQQQPVNNEQDKARPLFSLPANTSVQVSITTGPAAIDVTPSSNDD